MNEGFKKRIIIGIILVGLLGMLTVVSVARTGGLSLNKDAASSSSDNAVGNAATGGSNAGAAGSAGGSDADSNDDGSEKSGDKKDTESVDGSADGNDKNGDNNDSQGNEQSDNKENDVGSGSNLSMNPYDIEPEAIIDLAAITGSSGTADGSISSIYDLFVSYEIESGDKVFDRINGRSYVDNPNIGVAGLRYIRIPHYDYSHQIRLGEMIVNANIADSVLAIFSILFDNEYEIEQMRLIDDFWTGDGATSDDASIAANNTSAFCYRLIAGGSSLSNHAYGYAIDINPKQNPYYRVAADGSIYDLYEWDYDYLDRSSGTPHMILKGDICESTFSAYGFTWGGDWSNPVDYQHFEW